jgi:hypothetical protein
VSVEDIKAYNEAIFDTDRDRALKVVQDALDSGTSPEDVVFFSSSSTGAESPLPQPTGAHGGSVGGGRRA